jgi:hypothetical protein
MAVLNDTDRVTAWADMIDRMSRDRMPIDVTKAELRAALDATDQWVSDNAASFNAALPLPARTALTTAQKSMLLTWVLKTRFEKGV